MKHLHNKNVNNLCKVALQEKFAMGPLEKEKSAPKHANYTERATITVLGEGQ